MGKSLLGGRVGHQEEMMNEKLEEQGECLRREEKNNLGRKNRQVVEILEMKGLVHRRQLRLSKEPEKQLEVGREM